MVEIVDEGVGADMGNELRNLDIAEQVVDRVLKNTGLIAQDAANACSFTALWSRIIVRAKSWTFGFCDFASARCA